MQRRTLLTGKPARIVRNVLFWLLFTTWPLMGNAHFLAFYPLLLLVLLLSYGITGYLHNLWLIPRFLLRRRYLAYTLLLAALLAVTMVLSYYVTHFANRLVPGFEFMGKKDVPMLYHLFPTLQVLVMLAFGKFISDAVSNQQRIEDLEQRRLESELQSLRSQVNPHFLFNALNTIYGMARRTDATTAEAVIQLSDILRHSLYECNDAEIGIDREIRFIEQFVTFTRLRLHEQERISLQVNAEPQGQRIVPLLLIPFVENAIKHGLSQHSYDSRVRIRLRLDGNELFFSCVNTKVAPTQRTGSEDVHSGIGLKNVRRRLELLYPGKHHLEIRDEAQEFSVSLHLQLGNANADSSRPGRRPGIKAISASTI